MATDRNIPAGKSYRVLPLTLHIETLGDIATPLMLRGTPLPSRRSQIFSTAEDNQSVVEIHVLMGESPLASKNRSLGKFRLSGIPSAPRGIPQVTVTYSVDTFCRINATAAIANSALTITSELDDPSSFLTKEFIALALATAEVDKELDQNKVRKSEADLQGSAALKEAETLLASGTTLPGRNDQQISEGVAELGLAMESGDVERIHLATQQLQSFLHFRKAGIDPFGGFGSIFGQSIYQTAKPKPRSPEKTVATEKNCAYSTSPCQQAGCCYSIASIAWKNLWRWGLRDGRKPLLCLNAVHAFLETDLRRPH